MNDHNEHTLESENKLQLLALLLIENSQLKQRLVAVEKRLKDDEEMIDTLAIEMERINNE